ncbi:hypothetical protein BS47DRAFT_1490522 [Hydnum rufescens UP504]|uniref:Uncharacterized protein n=1 Tax=Hydnum rufescens UP504 TaxID=1448309 RepID=A0A9P6ACE8_9AGAM|nr:hypothetical protein BS47DRAFT_1490522 [Hydnum rufescens UP504]
MLFYSARWTTWKVNFEKPYDRGNPKDWPRLRKWAMTLQLGLCTLCVSAAPSAYSGSNPPCTISSPSRGRRPRKIFPSTIFPGLAFGPLIWAPLSEVSIHRHCFPAFLTLQTAVIGYLIDAYTIYCITALAANVLRSILATVLLLFTPSLLVAVGPQWGNAIFVCLALMCTPIPFLFCRYGPRIRARSKWATPLTTPHPTSCPVSTPMFPIAPQEKR